MFKSKKNQTNQNSSNLQTGASEKTSKQNLQKQKIQQVQQAFNTVINNSKYYEGDVLLREQAKLYQTNLFLKKQIIFTWTVIVILSIGLSFVIWFFLSQYPKTRYIATNNNEELCKIASLNKPPVSLAAVENFAQQAVLDFYRRDFANIEEHLQQTISRFFTTQGRQSVYNTIANINLIGEYQTNKIISRPMLIKAAQVEKEVKKANGSYTWNVSMTFKLDSYIGKLGIENAPNSSQNFVVNLKLVSQPVSLYNPAGIGIEQLIEQRQ